MRYFEDFQPGDTIELGSRGVTEESIIAFGREFDPQYFHTDPAAAGRSTFGGLVASGWHTTALYMRLLVDGLFHEAASLASPGMDQIRWLRPVRPGDTLSGRFIVLESTPSRSRPDRGALKYQGELRNQEGEMVMTLQGITLFARRPVPGAAATS